MHERARIGIIGAGFIGEAHIRGLQGSRRADVVAIADLDPGLLAARKEAYGIPRVYEDYAAMLREEELDGVVVATPDDRHREPVEAAAAAGVAVLLEKPIATTREDARAIADAVQRAGVACMLGFTLRVVPHYAEIKRRFESGEPGIPTTAYTKRSCTLGEARRIGGRCSVNEYLGVHDLDFLLWVFGHDVESIYTTTSEFRVAEAHGTPDHYWSLVRWRNGATAAVFATWGMPTGYPMYVEQEALVVGSKGSVHVNFGGQQMRVATDNAFVAPEVEVVLSAHAFQDQDGRFADVALGRAQPLADVHDGLRALELTLAGEESARSGRPVEVRL